MELYMRDDAPLSEEEWKAVDSAVAAAAKASLVGRRFVNLYGPLGAGVQALWVDRLTGVSPGATDIYGQAEGEVVTPSGRQLISLNLLHKDFVLFWRDIATSRAMSAPLDVSAAAAAAAMVARAEDHLIFRGAEGQPGIMTVPGRLEVEKEGGWEEPGSALATVAQARAALIEEGAMGPYALVLSPDLYTRLLRMHGQRGRLELELVQVVADAGVYQSPVLGSGEGAFLSSGPDVLDLAVSEDIQVAYVAAENLNHVFKVLESVALRIRRPEGICVLT